MLRIIPCIVQPNKLNLQKKLCASFHGIKQMKNSFSYNWKKPSPYNVHFTYVLERLVTSQPHQTFLNLDTHEMHYSFIFFFLSKIMKHLVGHKGTASALQ